MKNARDSETSCKEESFCHYSESRGDFDVTTGVSACLLFKNNGHKHFLASSRHKVAVYTYYKDRDYLVYVRQYSNCGRKIALLNLRTLEEAWTQTSRVGDVNSVNAVHFDFFNRVVIVLLRESLILICAVTGGNLFTLLAPKRNSKKRTKGPDIHRAKRLMR
mmetsp:Transcript_15334/g.17054  ORF Transcript_15334/g.17054 Transcript_15334/m.17054 type:complete len:162 (+) Transcript_15334:88-573(+)